MKKAAIVALVCANAALLLALIAGTGVREAYGQVIGANYLVVTGNITSGSDGIYIIDLASRRLLACRYDKRRQSPGFRAIAPRRNLIRDFDREEP